MTDLRSAIPLELRQHPQWVVFKTRRKTTRDGRQKLDKVPVSPRTLHAAATNNPATWSTFDQALEALHRGRGRFAGVGYVFTAGDPYVGVDLDGCRDPETGAIDAWAREVIERLDSYCELSISGTGLHVIVRGTWPGDRNKLGDGRIEVYDRLRFFTMSGQPLADTPAHIADRQVELDQLHAELVPEPTPAPVPIRSSAGVSDDDAELLERARRARGGDRFTALYDRGDLAAYGGDHSAADLALAGALRFWTGADITRMDRLFRASALYRPKWDARHRGDGMTYGDMTLVKALPGAIYQPREPDAPAPAEPAPAPAPPTGNDGEWWPAVAVETLAAKLREQDARIRALETELQEQREYKAFTQTTIKRADLSPAERIGIIGLGPEAHANRRRAATRPEGEDGPLFVLNYARFGETYGLNEDQVGDLVKITTEGDAAIYRKVKRWKTSKVRDRTTGELVERTHPVVSILPRPDHLSLADTTAAIRGFQPHREGTKREKDKARAREQSSARKAAEAAAAQLAGDAVCPGCREPAAITARATAWCSNCRAVVDDAVVVANAVADKTTVHAAEPLAPPPVEPNPPVTPHPRIAAHRGVITLLPAIRGSQRRTGRVISLMSDCRICGDPVPESQDFRPCKRCRQEADAFAVAGAAAEGG